MWMTVEFTNVYGGREHVSCATVEVDAPPRGHDAEALQEWADENLREHTGDGNATAEDAGYFAGIVSCAERPDLVGAEFQW